MEFYYGCNEPDAEFWRANAARRYAVLKRARRAGAYPIMLTWYPRNRIEKFIVCIKASIIVGMIFTDYGRAMEWA